MIRRLAALAVVPAVVLVSGCSLGTAEPATYVTDVSATLNAEVSSNQGGEVLYWFEWGTTTEYGNVTPDRALTFPEGHTSDDPRVQVSEPIAGLEPDTTYHYRACSSPGAEEGSRGCTNMDQTFTTGPAGSGRSGIAFNSQRDGFNAEVYAMDADGGSPTNLTNNTIPDSDPAWAPDGSKLAFTTQRSGPTDIWLMDADGGNQTRLTSGTGAEDSPAWSPDGSRIAFDANDGDAEVYVVDVDGANETNLTSNTAFDFQPAWSPDGSRIAFTSSRDGNPEVYVMDADGGNQTRLTNTPAFDIEAAWSPDGTHIAFRSNRDGNPEIYVMDADGSNQTNLTNTPDSESSPTWSPDGDQIAFNSVHPTENVEVSVMNADGSNPVRLTNSAGFDSNPAWSPRPEPPSLPTLYVAMGDSVANYGDPLRYPERFFSFLDAEEAADDLDNISVGGETSGSLISAGQLGTAVARIDDSATNTTVVTLDIGGNDILHQPSCYPPGASFNLSSCQPTLATFSTNFTSILDSLNESLDNDAGSEQLIVMAYYNPWSGRSDATAAANGQSVLLGSDGVLNCAGAGAQLGLNDRIACIGASQGAKLADAYPPFVGHGDDYFADEIHPNGTGHQVIADTFQATFEAP